jgi:hypothetical protein
VLPCQHGWKSRAFQAFALLSHIQSSGCSSPLVVMEWETLQHFMFSVMADLFDTQCTTMVAIQNQDLILSLNEQ